MLLRLPRNRMGREAIEWMIARSDRNVAPDRAKSADRGSLAYVTVIHIAVLTYAYLGGDRYALQLNRRLEPEW